jgi:UDP-glucose 4-epimerase
MSRTYLVTGGAGFIGSYLVEALLARGDDVVVIDDLSTGRLENLTVVHGHRGLLLVEGSVLDEPLVSDLARRCDAIVHLAAVVGVRLVLEAPLRALVANMRGAQVVFDVAARHRVPVLLASTSEIYGKNTAMPLAEDADRVLGPPDVARWTDSIGKSVDEIFAFTYCAERRVPSVVARLFNTAGARQSPAYGMVVPRLVRQAVRGMPLTVHGDGQQTRSFCHVRDVVEALVHLIDEPAAVGHAFNVGGTEEISMLALAHRIRDLLGSSSLIRLVPYAEAYAPGFEDMSRRVPDTSRLERLTGWRPVRTLDDIILEVAAEARGAPADPLPIVAVR